MIGIYHSADLDGFTSGAIIKRKYPDAKMIGYNYGEELNLPTNYNGEPIIMADVSVSIPKMMELAKISNNQFTWIDHHKSVIDEFVGFCVSRSSYGLTKDLSIYNYGGIKAVLKVGISACEITWKYLFPDEPMPRAILLLGEYDTWRREDNKRWENEIIPFQFGMRSICNSVETFPSYLFGDNDEIIDTIIEKGKAIIKYQSMVHEHLFKNAFEYEFEGLRAICMNIGGVNSEAFKSVYDESKHDIMKKTFNEFPAFECPITKDIVTFGNCHIDHFKPTFDEIVGDFINENGISDLRAVLAPNRDNQTICEVSDKELSDKFYKYHESRANLRVLSVKANLTNK